MCLTCIQHNDCLHVTNNITLIVLMCVQRDSDFCVCVYMYFNVVSICFPLIGYV